MSVFSEVCTGQSAWDTGQCKHLSSGRLSEHEWCPGYQWSEFRIWELVLCIHNTLMRDTDIFVFESGQDFDFSQSPLTVRLVLERRNLLYGYSFTPFLRISDVVVDGWPVHEKQVHDLSWCVSETVTQYSHNHSIRAFSDVLQISITRSHLKHLTVDRFRHGDWRTGSRTGGNQWCETKRLG